MPFAALKKKPAPAKPAAKPKPMPASPTFAAPVGMQTKLEVGPASDRFEQEADRTADSVMRMPNPGMSVTAAPLQISRKCAVCEREEKEGKDDKRLQKEPAGLAETSIDAAPASVHAVLRSPGQPLDPASRAYFEPRFGQEFGNVRVHTGMTAARSAREVSAHAYTVGQNIVFAAGRFAPATQTGRRLIAHELTHVVQQDGSQNASAPLVQRAPANYPSNAPLPAKSGEKADTPKPQISNDDLIGMMVSLRQQSPQDFVKILVSNETLIYRLLAPYGFQGSWTKDEAYLADFDAAIQKWGKATNYLLKFSSTRPAAVQPKPKSREERQYEDAQYLVIDMNRHGYTRRQTNEALESIGLMDDLKTHGFEEEGRWSFTNSEVYKDRAVRALNDFIGRYQTAHNINVPATASVPTPDPAEYYRVWLEGLNYVTTSFVGAEFAELASKFTDDPRKITAAAGLGAGLEGVAAGFAVHPGSYSPDVENKPTSVVVQELRYTGRQPIKPIIDPGKVGGPPPPERLPTPDPVPPARVPEDIRGIVDPSGGIRIRGTPPAQPTKEAVSRAEQGVTRLVENRYARAGVRDISNPDKDPYAPGVDRLFVIGHGQGAVLLEVDAKLSIQEKPVTIRDVSAFETAKKTGGASRRDLVDRARRLGLITADEHAGFLDNIEHGLVLEEVHGFGSVSGISSELSGPGGGVNYVQGEQFAHITQQLEQRGSQQLSAEIRLNLIAPAAEKRTGRQIANQIFKDFEAVFGATPKSTPLANPAPKKKK